MVRARPTHQKQIYMNAKALTQEQTDVLRKSKETSMSGAWRGVIVRDEARQVMGPDHIRPSGPA